MKEVETNFTDIFGNEIKEGDIVVRAIYSDLTFHKVIKITKKGVYLSRGETTLTRETYWYYNEAAQRIKERYGNHVTTGAAVEVK